MTKRVCDWRNALRAGAARMFAVGALILPTASGVAAQDVNGSSPAQRPNIVFILSDDHRYDFMGFMSDLPYVQTPNLDRMAREGVHLRNAFVTTSLCSPSRATILTGQYVHEHGVTDNQRLVPEGTTFFPQYLQEAGYQTAYIGKWHMGAEKDDPRPGFDHWVSFRGQGVYFNPTLNIDGQRAQREGYISDILTDEAIDWMGAQRDTARPFFLYLAHKAVHHPFAPAPEDKGRTADMPLRYPETMAESDEWPRWVQEQRNSFHGVDFTFYGEIPMDTLVHSYAESLYSMDRNIGRVLDYLTESGLAENTIVIYMGDNGFSLGEHGLIDKRHAYEESIRVPMLAWAPGRLSPGTTVSEMVLNVDVAPTILAFAGLAAPPHMQGNSFRPLLQGEQVPWRDTFLYEYYWEWNFPQQPTMFALRSDRYKYIHYYGVWEPDEFFDLAADPMEKNNLIRDPQQKERIAAMRDELFARLAAMDGMQIPIKQPVGGQLDRRGPAAP